jgi:aminopeptidase YwaD
MNAIIVSMLVSALLLVPAPTSFQELDGSVDEWRGGIVGMVSGTQIMATAEDLQAFGTRDFHTESAAEAAWYLFDRMESLGLNTTLQEFAVGDIMSANVVGSLNEGSMGEGVYLIGAHYDSENHLVDNQSEAENMTAPGADDNASGVGAMLEIARILSEEAVFAAPVTFVAFGAEESGYDGTGVSAGSAFFVDAASAQGTNISGAFVMDMIGFSSTDDKISTIISNGDSDPLYHSLANATEKYGVDLEVRFLMNPSLRYSDHRSFWDHGYLSVLLCEEMDPDTNRPANPYYHTSDDTTARLSEGQMAAVAKMLIGALLDLTDQGEDSYAKSYLVTLAALSISALVAVSALIAAIHLRRRRGVI